MKVSKVLIVLLIVLCASGVIAAPVRITGPTQVDAYKFVDLIAEGDKDTDINTAIVFWDIDQEALVDVRESSGGRLTFVGPPGVYKIKCRVIPVKDGKISGQAITTRITVTIGVPTPPVPPSPPVPPTPPVPPSPPQPPAPISGDGFRVLILEDSTQRTKLPAAQQNVILGRTVRDYLNLKTVIGPDGKTHEWRIWDKDVDASNEAKTWQEAMKRPHPSMPWVIISNGKTGYEGPLPSTPDEILNLLKKYDDSK